MKNQGNNKLIVMTQKNCSKAFQQAVRKQRETI
jgi:hypothetical protein